MNAKIIVFGNLGLAAMCIVSATVGGSSLNLYVALFNLAASALFVTKLVESKEDRNND